MQNDPSGTAQPDSLAARRPAVQPGANWTSTRTADQVWQFRTDGASPLHLTLPGASVHLQGFTSSWGMEFTPVSHPTQLALSVDAGRSSQGAMPWLGVEGEDFFWIVTAHWSGNWAFEATAQQDPQQNQTQADQAQAPADHTSVTFSFPDHHGHDQPVVSVAVGRDRAEAAARLTSSLALSAPRELDLLTEWNPWWPYEDADISEDVFLANAAVAAKLGLEVAVLDAGWFGVPGDTDWFQVRGDWTVINTQRFPHGLAWLANQTRSLGIEFGIWIEGEALGRNCVSQHEHPDIVARGEDDSSLEYVCLGSGAGREWALRQASDLVSLTGAVWVKWDFNLDPGAGCRRSDHGHSAEDGLKAHYDGLYALFDQLRAEFPNTIWEACASGGLRIDAGLAAHVDCLFLSDPDWTEHHLKCLWGASQLLPARQILHWPQGEWRPEHRFQKADYSGTLISASQFDSALKAAMLHRFGISARLTEMRPDLRERLRIHLDVWKSTVRPLLREGVLVPLSGQPEINEQGDRQPAFQLSHGGVSLVSANRLPPVEPWRPIRPRGLDESARYRVTPLAASEGFSAEPVERSGAELNSDGLISADEAVRSALWLIEALGTAADETSQHRAQGGTTRD